MRSVSLIDGHIDDDKERCKMTNFDYEKEINDLEYPAMFKAGLKYYIDANKIKINSKKDFDKLLDKFKDLKIGE